MAGYLTVLGRRAPFDAKPWATLPEASDVAIAAHSFCWLPELADGGAAERARGRQLISEWLETNTRWSPLAWRDDVLADRLSVWAHWLPAFLDEASDDEVRKAALASFMFQARHLARTGGSAPPEDWRAFAVARGLIRVGLSLPGDDSLLPIGLRRLEAEIARQILPDGGHFQRCPSIHMRVLALLTDMRAVMESGQCEVPPFLQGAVDRMAPMLRLFRLGDGGLTLANGGGEEDRKTVDAILDASGAKGKGMINAPHSGFQRIAAGPVVVIADTGTPPPPGAQSLAHAGTLAFEVSVGPHRLIVNCGTPAGSHTDWADATRATAAHSTVCIDDTNAIEFLPGGRIGVGPSEVLSQRRESEGATWLDTEHDGYVKLLGVRHKRRFFLDGSGEDFRGEDLMVGDGGKTFRIRFHLHPQVKASLIQGGKGVLLRLPGGAGWRFLATGGTVSLEDSIYLGSGRARRAEQIVVAGLLDSHETSVKWRFARVGPG
jgi:uncharacterized heparinase superfamily protein